MYLAVALQLLGYDIKHIESNSKNTNIHRRTHPLESQPSSSSSARKSFLRSRLGYFSFDSKQPRISTSLVARILPPSVPSPSPGRFASSRLLFSGFEAGRFTENLIDNQYRFVDRQRFACTNFTDIPINTWQFSLPPPLSFSVSTVIFHRRRKSARQI